MPLFSSRAAAFFARIKRALGLGGAAVDGAAGAGLQGERQAAEFLRRERGYVVVARNWRNPKDRREEIDLIVRDGSVLVFVEVKTRAANALVSGFNAVNARKKTILRRAIRAYLRGLGEKPSTFRFDIMEVELAARPTGTKDSAVAGPGFEVRHYENVALLPKHFQP